MTSASLCMSSQLLFIGAKATVVRNLINEADILKAFCDRRISKMILWGACLNEINNHPSDKSAGVKIVGQTARVGKSRGLRPSFWLAHACALMGTTTRDIAGLTVFVTTE